MSKEFDKMAQELEASMLEEMKKIYSEKAIERFLKPKNIGMIEKPDGFARIKGPCGDTMEIYLKVDSEGKISEATFLTDGCGTTIACGTTVTELVKGKTLDEALEIGSKEILEDIGGLPESDVHCSVLAANTLKKAIQDCKDMLREPWKKMYRKITPLFEDTSLKAKG